MSYKYGTDKDSTLIKWLHKVTSQTVVVQDQDHNRPKGCYISIREENIELIGRPCTEINDENKEINSQLVEINYSVNIYSKVANYLYILIMSNRDSGDLYNQFWGYNVKLISVGTGINLSGLDQNEVRDRMQFSIKIRTLLTNAKDDTIDKQVYEPEQYPPLILDIKQHNCD